MALYKGIYYADGTVGMSNSQISYNEGINYGDSIETVSLNIPLHVASASERDAKYPSPTNGTAVWRTDLGVEQRYSSSVTTPGWYNVTTGMMIIRAGDFSFGGATSGSSGNVTDFGVVNFTDKSSIYLNGIFSPAFTNYKIFFNLGKTFSATDVLFQYTTDGVPNSSALYSRSYYYANQAGALTAGQATTSTYSGLLGSSGTARCGMAELTLFSPFSSYPSWKTFSNNFVYGAGSPPWTWNEVGYFNSASVAFDGIVIYGTADMTGSIMVYGFN